MKPVTRLPEFEDIRIAADCPNDIITIAASNDSNSGDPRFLYANEVCAYLFGYGVTDIVGSSIAKFDGPNTDRRTLSTQLPTQQLLFRQNASSHAC